MSEKQNDFAWVDDLLKRWPIILFLFAAVVWSLRLEFTQNAQASEIKEMNESLKGLSAIQAEWPYLKQKVEDIGKKTDQIDAKLNILVNRSS